MGSSSDYRLRFHRLNEGTSMAELCLEQGRGVVRFGSISTLSFFGDGPLSQLEVEVTVGLQSVECKFLDTHRVAVKRVIRSSRWW